MHCSGRIDINRDDAHEIEKLKKGWRMSDVVVRVELENQADEEALSAAILAYAQWRSGRRRR